MYFAVVYLGNGAVQVYFAVVHQGKGSVQVYIVGVHLGDDSVQVYLARVHLGDDSVQVACRINVDFCSINVFFIPHPGLPLRGEGENDRGRL